MIDNTEHLARQLDAGEIDVAVIQVADRDLRTDDVVLWTDVLCWVTSCEAPFDEGVVPLVTFGEHCFYRSFSEPLLTASGIDHTVAFSGHWTGGVRAAVEAGLGVGVLPSRHLGGDLVEWRRGRDGPPLPRIHQVARTVPGERPAVGRGVDRRHRRPTPRTISQRDSAIRSGELVTRRDVDVGHPLRPGRPPEQERPCVP